MNHIHKLQQDIRQRDNALSVANTGLAELKSYLLSPKFNSDTTVQVNDVLLRIGEIEKSILDASESTPAA